jgi:uncharacterized protein (TIGR02246 family)
MTDAKEVVQAMCDRYQAAVCANDSAAFGRLFAGDAISVPPGSEPERGQNEIARGQQKYFDQASWSVEMTPLDALGIGDDWSYGIVGASCKGVSRKDGSTESFNETMNWLLKRQPSGTWLIARELWNER